MRRGEQPEADNQGRRPGGRAGRAEEEQDRAGERNRQCRRPDPSGRHPAVEDIRHSQLLEEGQREMIPTPCPMSAWRGLAAGASGVEKKR